MNSKYLVFVGMGFELVGIMLGSIYLGQWIDQNYNTQGLGLVGFSMAGLAGWIFHIVQLARQIEKNKET